MFTFSQEDLSKDIVGISLDNVYFYKIGDVTHYDWNTTLIQNAVLATSMHALPADVITLKLIMRHTEFDFYLKKNLFCRGQRLIRMSYEDKLPISMGFKPKNNATGYRTTGYITKYSIMEKTCADMSRSSMWCVKFMGIGNLETW